MATNPYRPPEDYGSSISKRQSMSERWSTRILRKAVDVAIGLGLIVLLNGAAWFLLVLVGRFVFGLE